VLLTAAEGQFTSVSAGTRRTCALNAERHAACWNHSYVSFPVPPYDNLNLVSAVPNYARQQPVDVAPWPDGGLLIADLEGPGPHRAWALRGSEEIFWPSVTVSWLETRSFERARREIPVLWGFGSEDDELTGEIESVSSHFQTLEGEGLILPVLGVHEVAGQVTFGDTQVAVKGFLRHFQR